MHTKGINHFNVVNVIRLSHLMEIFRDIPEHTLGINHINVVNVIRLSHKREFF